MKIKIMMLIFSFCLALPGIVFSQESPKEVKSSVRSDSTVNEAVKLKRSRAAFNSRANKLIRARKLAQKKFLEDKKKMEEDEDKGEGQVKVKF